MKDVTVPTILFDDSKTRSKVLRSDENNVVFKLYSLIHNTLLYSKDQRDVCFLSLFYDSYKTSVSSSIF